MVSECEDLLAPLSITMDPEDGRLYVVGTGEDAITTFTRDGIEYLQELVSESRK